MTLSLPIPGKKEKLAFFYVPYNLGEDYINNKGEVFMSETDNIRNFRALIQQKYGLDEGSYIITGV
jgi:hypothetical protein